MSNPYKYLIKGAKGRYNSQINGFEFTAFMILDNVPGSNDIEVEFNALVDPNVPLAGSDLSAIDSRLTGCWLRTIDAESLGKGQVKLTLVYQQSLFGISQIEESTRLSQVQTNRDVNGSPFNLTYIYRDDYGGDNPSAEQTRLRTAGLQTQGGTVTVLKPERLRVYTVREPVDPAVVNAAYGGRVNSTLWQNGEPGTWLLSVTGSSDNSGVRLTTPIEWINRYEFQERIGGWDPTAVFSDQLTAEPVHDPDPLSGLHPRTPPVFFEAIKQIPSYLTADFWDLFDGNVT